VRGTHTIGTTPAASSSADTRASNSSVLIFAVADRRNRLVRRHHLGDVRRPAPGDRRRRAVASSTT
jgi:hypothetical protein